RKRQDNSLNKHIDLVPCLFFIFIELRFHSHLDFFVKCLIVLQNFFGSVASLRQLRSLVIQPRSALFDDCFSRARSSSDPVVEIPSLYIMSNSASVKG